MKKQHIFYLAAIVVIAAIAAGIFLLTGGQPEEEAPAVSPESCAPSRLTEIGPYVKNITMTEKIGSYDLVVSARRLNMKKTKFMGFSCGLYKKVAAHGTRVTLYKDREKVLELYKDDLIMPPGMKVIEMRSPQVVFPDALRNVRKVVIDKERKIVRLYRGDSVDTWKLAD